MFYTIFMIIVAGTPRINLFVFSRVQKFTWSSTWQIKTSEHYRKHRKTVCFSAVQPFSQAITLIPSKFCSPDCPNPRPAEDISSPHTVFDVRSEEGTKRKNIQLIGGIQSFRNMSTGIAFYSRVRQAAQVWLALVKRWKKNRCYFSHPHDIQPMEEGWYKKNTRNIFVYQ